VEATVADYFRMLSLELAGQHYNKAAHNRDLGLLLQNRSHGAIELKHQNISTILLELGCVYIAGYKPRGKYQQLLYDVVAQRVAGDVTFDRVAMQARSVRRSFRICVRSATFSFRRPPPERCGTHGLRVPSSAA
jgi:hypothetical protein